MPKAKLTLSKIETAHRPGMLNDGGGLYLSVAAGGSKSWCFRFTLGNRRRTMGLGGIAKLNLAEARERARQCRELVEQGIDPIDYRRGDRMLTAAKTAMTFGEAALAYIDAHKDGWTEQAYTRQWSDHFELYVFPEIGALPMPAVNDTDVVLRVLEPIWTTRPVNRLEPARADRDGHQLGHISRLLHRRERRAVERAPGAAPAASGTDPRASGIIRRCPIARCPGFCRSCASGAGSSPWRWNSPCFTVGRQNETRWARWPEFDLDAGIWTIPAERMKMRREHRVALNEPALAVLRKVARLKRREDDFVFPGLKAGKPLSQHVMKTLMRCMGYAGIATAHGFRSTLQRLGDRTDRLLDRGDRAGLGARRRQQGRGRLSARRSARKTPAPEPGLGRFLPRPDAARGIEPDPVSRTGSRRRPRDPDRAGAGNSQNQPQTRQPRSILSRPSGSITARNSQKRRRVPVRTPDPAQLALDFGPHVEPPVSRAEGRPRHRRGGTA